MILAVLTPSDPPIILAKRAACVGGDLYLDRLPITPERADAHRLARHPDADEAARWQAFARTTIVGRPELRAAIDRLNAIYAKNERAMREMGR